MSKEQRDAMAGVCREMGMELHRYKEHADGSIDIQVRTVPSFARMRVDALALESTRDATELLIDVIDDARAALFDEAAKHIVEHGGRGPYDRLTEIETAAMALVENLVELGVPGETGQLMLKLHGLLRSKPGAVAWRDLK